MAKLFFLIKRETFLRAFVPKLKFVEICNSYVRAVCAEVHTHLHVRACESVYTVARRNVVLLSISSHSRCDIKPADENMRRFDC